MKKNCGVIKTYLITGALALAISIAICTALTLFVINIPPQQPPTITPPPKDEPSENVVPTLTVPSTISVDLLATKKFNYTISNLGDYVVSIQISDSNIATINSENLITPKNVGSCKIITSINTTPAIVKETTLIVLDCTKQVNFIITDQSGAVPERYYTNTYYYLEIAQNIMPNINPEIFYDNIEEFTLIKTENSSFFFKFKIISGGTFTFKYKGLYVEKTENYFAYKLPTNYKINFSNNLLNNNTINLYLINNNYVEIANNNNIYSEISYLIIKESEFDEITISEFNTNIINIENNKIKALTEGTTTITFTSSLSNVKKSYTVNVSKIKPTSILINGITNPLNSENTIELSLQDLYAFTYSLNPLYSFGDASISFDSTKVSYNNGNLYLLTNNPAVVTILYNSEIIYTLTITPKPEITHSLTLTNATTEATLSNNTLRVKQSSSAFIQLTCLAYTSGTLATSQNYELEIKNESIIRHADSSVYNGVINLEILSAGETELIIYDTINNITITLLVVVS